MRVLVTGGNGFIGRHVCAELAEQGHDPVVLDHHREGPLEPHVFLGDVRDATAVTEAAAHVDGIIHLAAVLGTAETISNPRPAYETNIGGALNVFEAAVQYDLPAVYIAVGNHWMNNPYSITKTAAERFAHMYNKERGGRIAVVRAMNAYGAGQTIPAPWGPGKVRKIMPTFAAQAVSGEPVTVFGDGEQVMDMIHVTDVARDLVWALDHAEDFTFGDVVFFPTSKIKDLTADELTQKRMMKEMDVAAADPNVVVSGTGRRTTVNDIARAVLFAANGADPDQYITHLPMRPGEPPGSEVVAPYVREGLVTLEEGAAEVVADVRQRLGL